jgi:predicted dehydrogenase
VPAMPLPAPIRLALIGCGAVAERYHLPALLESPDVQVAAVVDPTIERAHALARKAGDPPAFSTHDQLPPGIDLALVTVPNAVHEPIASDLLRRGVHVLVEKPMARSVDECDRMIEAARATGAVLAVGHDFRQYPVAQYAYHLFQSGLLGAVSGVDVRQSTGSGWPAATSAVLSATSGGGVLIDFGVHLLDLLLWWLGDLTAVAHRDDAAGGVEAECQCEMALATGAPVRMELSRTRTLRDTVVVHCERGSVELGVFDPAVIRLSLPGATVLAGAVPDPPFDRAPMRTVFARQLAEVIGAVRDGREPLVPGWQGRRAVALVEACYGIREPLRFPWDIPESYAFARRAGS